MQLALLQTPPQSTIQTALGTLETAAQSATRNGAEILVTPEMFIGGYNIGADQISNHADKAQTVCERLARIATTHGIALIVGLAMPAAPRPYNACVVIDKTGTRVAQYNKTHLFGDVDATQFSAGTTLSPVITLNGWRIGLAVCYDIEFPEVARSLALRGAEVIIIPTANMTPFDSVATRLVPARAEENAIFTAYCNYVGAEGRFAYNGQSCVNAPDGTDIVRGDDHGDHILYATLDRDVLGAARKTHTHMKDRRADIYGDLP